MGNSQFKSTLIRVDVFYRLMFKNKHIRDIKLYFQKKILKMDLYFHSIVGVTTVHASFNKLLRNNSYFNKIASLSVMINKNKYKVKTNIKTNTVKLNTDRFRSETDLIFQCNKINSIIKNDKTGIEKEEFTNSFVGKVDSDILKTKMEILNRGVFCELLDNKLDKLDSYFDPKRLFIPDPFYTSIGVFPSLYHSPEREMLNLVQHARQSSNPHILPVEPTASLSINGNNPYMVPSPASCDVIHHENEDDALFGNGDGSDIVSSSEYEVNTSSSNIYTSFVENIDDEINSILEERNHSLNIGPHFNQQNVVNNHTYAKYNAVLKESQNNLARGSDVRQDILSPGSDITSNDSSIGNSITSTDVSSFSSLVQHNLFNNGNGESDTTTSYESDYFVPNKSRLPVYYESILRKSNPYDANDTPQTTFGRYDHSEQCGITESMHSNGGYVVPASSIGTRPKHPNMEALPTRISTFYNFSKAHVVSPKQLAINGFFARGSYE